MELLGGVLTAQEVGGEREGPKEQKSEQAWQGHSAVFLICKLDKPGMEETEGRLPQHFKEAWSVGGRIPFPMVWGRIPQSAICVTMENTVKPSARSLLIPHNPTTLFKAHFKSVFPSLLKI